MSEGTPAPEDSAPRKNGNGDPLVKALAGAGVGGFSVAGAIVLGVLQLGEMRTELKAVSRDLGDMRSELRTLTGKVMLVEASGADVRLRALEALALDARIKSLERSDRTSPK